MEVLLEVTPSFEKRGRNDIYIAKLILKWIASCPVKERSDREIKFPLEVTLLIVFFHLD
jgi:hypothetical protein